MKNRSHKKVIDVVSKMQEPIRLPDQDGLNIVFHNNWYRLDRAYNMTLWPFIVNIEDKSGLNTKIRRYKLPIMSKTILLHFTGPKPWNKEYWRTEELYIFWRLLYKSGYYTPSEYFINYFKFFVLKKNFIKQFNKQFEEHLVPEKILEQSATIPVFSLAMITHNDKDYIGKAIQSLQRQSESEWELLILNNGSYDKGEEIARTFAEKDTRIQVLHCSPVSRARARNLVYQAVNKNSMFLLFLEGDDYLHPDALTKMRQALEENPNYVAVQIEGEQGPYVKEVLTPQNRNQLKRLEKSDFSLGISPNDLSLTLPALVKRPGLLHLGQLLIRHEFFAKIGTFDESLPFASDWKMCAQLLAQGDFLPVSQTLISWHYYKESDIVLEISEKRRDAMMQKIREYILGLSSSDIDSKLKSDIDSSYSTYCLFLQKYHQERIMLYIKKGNIGRVFRHINLYIRSKLHKAVGGMPSEIKIKI